MKKICFALLVLFLIMAAKATILLQDNLNYPYNNGLIATQGDWYVYNPPASNDAYVVNNVLILNTTNHDEVATPTNGWVNATGYDYASFQIMCTQLPTSTNGGYFCQFQDDNDTNDACHVFLDTIGTTIPGTFRLGIANYASSFNSSQPPYNFPEDLATNTPYTIVILFDNSGDFLQGATLWINPSENDFENAYGLEYTGSPGVGYGYAYGTDTTTSTGKQDIVVSQIGFSPYADAGVSNVIAATTFAEVNVTNPPVWGIQPQSQVNYSGNPATYYTLASGVDVTYQWYSTNYGALSDGPSYAGVTFVGSQSNILVINNQQTSDVYYTVAIDAYGNAITNVAATNTVITTPTAPFFTNAPVNTTNNLFTSTGFTNIASGTGPLFYQWYFAPTNLPATYTALSGQTGPGLNLSLANYSYQGTYYVVASNATFSGSITYGPTNTLTIIAPTTATLPQLHALMISQLALIKQNSTTTVYINSNNVVAAGYVTSWTALGNPGSSYSEFFIQYNGSGIEVYSASPANSEINTNQPPIGTYVVVTGPIGVFDTALEIEPATAAQIVPTNAPSQVEAPLLANSIFNDLVTNGFGTNAMNLQDALLTFTNVYISKTHGGTPIGNGGLFYSNSYTEVYFTIDAPYSTVTGNTNQMEIFQPSYNYGTNSSWPGFVNQFDGKPVPTHCYQLTGVYGLYKGTPQFEPSRVADYLPNPPSSPPISISQNNGGTTITASQASLQTGSTYSVVAAPKLTGTWTNAAYGLGYWPTNVTFTDTNTASAKFYSVTSP